MSQTKGKRTADADAPRLVGGDDFGGPIVEDPPAIPHTERVREILTDNLFKDAKNSVLTLTFGAVMVWVAIKATSFVFFNTKVIDGVERSGFEVVRNELRNYMLGPNWERIGVTLLAVWIGIWLIAFALGGAMALLHDPEAPPMRPRTKAALFGVPVIGIGAILSMTQTIGPTLGVLVAVAVMLGARMLLLRVPDAHQGKIGLLLLAALVAAFGSWTGWSIDNLNEFGGLQLTFAVSLISIVACFPIGIVMALVRRSSFPALRPIAVGYIEFIRGVPLISLLFIGQFALGFLLPAGMETPGDIQKAIIMITLFSAAYVAEIVRGGLQSVPNGQVEGGQAVGLSPLTITRKIVLPQALRNSIPPLIGQFISLLKDTTLLFIIGQREILGVVPPILQTERYRFQGFSPEAYAFVAFVFWVICFTMSRASQRLETRLGVGSR